MASDKKAEQSYQDWEKPLFDAWKKQGYFGRTPGFGKNGANTYTIVIPPPNVTGMLHMGHALNDTIQDTCIRRARMQGYQTRWILGTDHAGIATQTKVDKKLAEEGISRLEIGREKFIDACWDWREDYGNTIVKQIAGMGCSCDYDDEKFTMSPEYAHAVRKVFCDWYHDGLIYKGRRIVNWCPSCTTAIADDEAEYVDEKGHLWYLRYPLSEPVDGMEYVIVATTRPETMLGDTGVAVNPEDEKFKHLIGKTCILPLVGREIPIVGDEYCEIGFGTGAVKMTPAHDPNDFEVGLRHHLEVIRCIADDGRINENGGKYEGMDRYECRKAIVADLEAEGYLVKTEPYSHNVGTCYRCHNDVEPLISAQWFVKMAPLAKEAIRVVEDGTIKFVPERFTKTYINWMENVHDWCISRQLWWGHQIPAWTCDDCGHINVSREDPTRCEKCGSTHLTREEDVLDTWFSSALWPFSTMGWPDNTELLKQFYPTSVLVTGYDIIFFWVARMLIMGMEFMKEIPFEKVFIHGLVRDSQGRKMSKSLGNGIDPLEVIEKYGADTLRFMLITGNTPGNDMRFYWERVEGTRNFANKIWNASRFALMNMEGYDKDAELAPYTLADKWILSRLQDTVKDVTGLLERFELGEAGRAIYDFIWSEVCDWYIEIAKPRLYNKEAAAERATAQHVLATVLVSAMKLLHPYMPFITEEIYQCLPHEAESIMISKWPVADESLIDPEAERGMNAIMDSIKAIRNMRAEVNANPGKKIPAIMLVSEDLREVVAHNDSYIKLLGGIDNLELRPLNGEKPENAMAAVVTGIEVYLPLAGLIDVEKETQRLSKELAAMEKDLQRAGGKLNNAGFLAKAPEDVIAKERAKYEELSGKIEAVKKRMAYLAELK